MNPHSPLHERTVSPSLRPNSILFVGSVLLTFFAVPQTFAADLPDEVLKRYQECKAEVLEKFVDEHDLVCNRRGDEFVDQGDCGWRTGLFVFCLAAERDHQNAARFLQALHECWRDGRPVRHPGAEPYRHYRDEENLYSRDQFYPQLAAIYYSHKYGNEEVRKLATELLDRFIQVLMEHDWRFNTGSAAKLPITARFVLREVADDLDLDHHWDIDGGSALEERAREMFQELQYDVYRQAFDVNVRLQAELVETGVAKPESDKAAAASEVLLKRCEERLAKLRDDMKQISDLKFHELHKLEEILKDIQRDFKELAKGLGEDATELSRGAKDLVRIDKDDPMGFYAIHNLFWQILLVYECQADSDELHDYTTKLADACRRHHMAPLPWLTGNEDKPREWLRNWPDEWNRVGYVWQRNLAQQRAQARTTDTSHPDLDYMVLEKLVEIRAGR